MSGNGSVLKILYKFPTGVLIDWFCKIRNNLLFNVINLGKYVFDMYYHKFQCYTIYGDVQMQNKQFLIRPC